jgi:hypothetical protein
MSLRVSHWMIAGKDRIGRFGRSYHYSLSFALSFRLIFRTRYYSCGTASGAPTFGGARAQTSQLPRQVPCQVPYQVPAGSLRRIRYQAELNSGNPLLFLWENVRRVLRRKQAGGKPAS